MKVVMGRKARSSGGVSFVVDSVAQGPRRPGFTVSYPWIALPATAIAASFKASGNVG